MCPRTTSTVSALLLGLGAVGLACTGSIMDRGGSPQDDGDPTTQVAPGNGLPVTKPGGGGAASGGAGGSAATDTASIPSSKPPVGSAACRGDLPVTPRMVRLTRLQYENSIRDLTGLDVNPSTAFDVDPDTAGYNRGLRLEVGDRVATLYRDWAETISQQVVASPANVQRLAGCDPASGPTCVNAFIAGFGKRAFRRPLTAAEQARYAALFAQGPMVVDGTADTFTKGVQLVVEAVFQSPTFLYRQELSTKRDGNVIPLSSFEVATRLAYALTNTTPDPMLLAAAERGELADPDMVAAQARRLLGSAAGKATLRDFHGQWLDTDNWDDSHLTKDAKAYPGFTPALRPTLVKEAQMFIESLADAGLGFGSLLGAPYTFANRDTARWYGLKGTFGTDPQRVDLPGTQRAGVLTQLGFLATHAYSDRPSPIHRGAFIQRRILCTPLPDPPAQVPKLPPSPVGKTNRQVVDEHTAGDGCSACHHGLINPIGFGLENYDAVGQWRTMDNGLPVDATGSLVGTLGQTAFNGPIEEVQAIAGASESRTCYARQIWRYAFGRADEDGDACALQKLADSLHDKAYGARELLADIARTRTFLSRAAEVP